MHIHIHFLIHYMRHARLLVSNARFFGTLLFMLLFSLLQLVGSEPASAMPAAKKRPVAIGSFHPGGAVALGEYSGPAVDSGHCPAPDVLSRFKPGIVTVPRMNRTPKPKSVYRSFARAPGISHGGEI